MIRIADTKTMIRVFLLGSAVGAGAAAVVGLLFAPKRGAGLRDDVKSNAGSLLNGAEGALGRASGRSSFAQQDPRQVEIDESTMLPYAGSIL
jgi:gas vesicle protein